MSGRTPEETLQANVEAYNAHDLDAFLATYAPDARFCKLDGTVLLSDRNIMGAYYKQFFEQSPNVRCEIPQRAVMGPFVIDHQRIVLDASAETPRGMDAMVISEVRDGFIVRCTYSPL